MAEQAFGSFAAALWNTSSKLLNVTNGVLHAVRGAAPFNNEVNAGIQELHHNIKCLNVVFEGNFKNDQYKIKAAI